MLNSSFRKRVLIVSSSFFPENSPRSFRATELTKEFARLGHSVTVLTLPYGADLDDFGREHSVTIKCLPKRFLKNFTLSGQGLQFFLKKAFNRILLQAFEYPDIELMYNYWRRLKNETGYDLVISFAMPYPVHWGMALARSMKHRIGTVWVADCGDPYVGNESSFKRLFYFAWIERWMFRKVDFISIPIIEAVNGYESQFQGKIIVIPQGLRFEEYAKNLPVYTKNSIPTFAYAGTLTPKHRDPRAFLEFLLTLNLNFRFVLYTQSVHLVKDYENRSHGRIQALPYVTRAQLISQLATMDFLVNFENRSLRQAPSKLIDYYLTGRPILSVGSHGFSKERTLEFLKGNYVEELSGHDYERYRIEKVADQFLNLIHRQ